MHSEKADFAPRPPLGQLHETYASSAHSLCYVNSWRHPQKRKYIALSSEQDRATATGNMYRNLMKFWRVVFEICERTDKQTERRVDKQTYRHTLLVVLRIPTGCEVTRTRSSAIAERPAQCSVQFEMFMNYAYTTLVSLRSTFSNCHVLFSYLHSFVHASF